MPDAARALFGRFRDGGASRMREAVEVGESESFLLDFKTNRDKGGRSSGEVTKETRAVLAKALSAFANSGGGVLVWGIEDREERAASLVPIPDVATFVAGLDRDTASLASPPVDGVEHAAILDPELTGGAGYAATFIPDGRVKPHRSEASGQYTYYLRSGGTSVVMPDSAVRAFVTAQVAPSLKLQARVLDVEMYPEHWNPYNGSRIVARIEARIQIEIANEGSAVAEGCAYALEVSEHLRHNYQVQRIRLQYNAGTFRADLIAPSDLRIFPDTVAEMITLDYKTVRLEAKDGRFRPESDISLRYAVYARGFSEVGEIVIKASELATLPRE